MKNKKTIISLIAVVVVILILFLLAYMTLGNDLFGGLAEVFSLLLATKILLYLLYIVLGIIAFAIVILFVLPFVAYIISKIATYASLALICLKEKHTFKIRRLPFASIKGVNMKADIEILMEEKKIYVHFLDVPLGFRKVLTIIDELRYCISSTNPGGVKRIGGHLGANFSGGDTKAFFGKERNITDENDVYKILPAFERDPKEYHYLIVSPGYVVARAVVGNGAKDIAAETAIGNITVCKAKIFKKRLKKQLHAPMNNGRG